MCSAVHKVKIATCGILAVKFTCAVIIADRSSKSVDDELYKSFVNVLRRDLNVTSLVAVAVVDAAFGNAVEEAAVGAAVIKVAFVGGRVVVYIGSGMAVKHLKTS